MIDLTGYELEILVEALRRDMRRELELCHTEPHFRFAHYTAARRDQQLLEVLNPKDFSATR